jgi:hypothetical protein
MFERIMLIIMVKPDIAIKKKEKRTGAITTIPI